MQVISTHTRIFENPNTQEKVTVPRTPQGRTATVPNWARLDPYFAMCEEDGSITEVKVATPKKVEKPIVAPLPKITRAVVGDAGLQGPAK